MAPVFIALQTNEEWWEEPSHVNILSTSLFQDGKYKESVPCPSTPITSHDANSLSYLWLSNYASISSFQRQPFYCLQTWSLLVILVHICQQRPPALYVQKASWQEQSLEILSTLTKRMAINDKCYMHTQKCYSAIHSCIQIININKSKPQWNNHASIFSFSPLVWTLKFCWEGRKKKEGKVEYALEEANKERNQGKRKDRKRRNGKKGIS